MRTCAREWLNRSFYAWFHRSPDRHVWSERLWWYTAGMMENLPQNLSALSPERVDQAANARDERISALFRRWPALSKVETSELKRLYLERLRVAKYVGAMRTRLLRELRR